LRRSTDDARTAAQRKYVKALQRFNDFVVDGKMPDELP